MFPGRQNTYCCTSVMHRNIQEQPHWITRMVPHPICDKGLNIREAIPGYFVWTDIFIYIYIKEYVSYSICITKKKYYSHKCAQLFRTCIFHYILKWHLQRQDGFSASLTALIVRKQGPSGLSIRGHASYQYSHIFFLVISSHLSFLFLY